MDAKIDIVIPWVDGSDEKWIAEKEKYSLSYDGDKRKNRFRDWDNLQYCFRGIEKFMPWVRKVHFITWGHIPTWLNTECPKLNIVKHQDYIPEEYLPVFSSHPIEMNMHRIEDLSEQFIYLNDDMFIISMMKEEDFFKEGLPCDMALQNVHQFKKGGIDHIIASNLEVINDKFNKRECVKNNRSKLYSFKYGKGMLKNLYLLPFGRFTGFENQHLPVPYLKRMFKQVWEEYPEVLKNTSKNKFRSATDVNQWVVRYWQFASGEFVPAKNINGRFFAIGQDDAIIEDVIKNQKCKMICLSDDDVNVDFDKEKEFIKQCFETILPEKSAFEL